MDRFIQASTLTTIRKQISGSTSDEVVTIKIRRDSDEYWWNFATSAFQVGSLSGVMTYDSDEVWKSTFIPNASGTFSIWIGYGDQISFDQLESVGDPAPASYTGSTLVSVAEVKEFLDIPETETNNDAMLLNIIVRTQSEAENYCGRIFTAADYTEYHNGDMTGNVIVNNSPIVSISALCDDTSREYGAETLIDPSDYVFDEETGIVELDGLCFDRGLKNIKVVYRAGYGTGGATLPNDLKNALIKLAAADYVRGKMQVSYVRGESFVDKSKKLRDEAMAILQGYMRLRII